MKQNPYIRKIVERMAPGVLSRSGFLGKDRRPLEEILDTDNSEVVRLGTSHEALANKLRGAFLEASDGLGTAVEIDESLRATHTETMGRIPCPWGVCGTFPKGEITLEDRRSGEKLVFTPLEIHMISEHGFYQGRGSRYRIGPGDIHRIFRMK